MAALEACKKIEQCVLLYVEDDDAAAYLFQTALEDAGLNPRVYRVTDGDQATTFLLQGGAYESAPRPDLVLLDLNLPRKSGLDVLAEVRHKAEFRELPVIVFTASVYDRGRAMELGATAYISKPIGYDELVGVAKRICAMLAP